MAVTSFMTVTTSLFAAGPGTPASMARPLPALSTPISVTDAADRHYTGLAEHFSDANTTADGKLTLAQAEQAGWSRVIRHFGDIDTRHAGFVTIDQIHSYNLAHRHRRKGSGV